VKKKGMIGWSELIKWLLGIFIVLVIIFTFFGPQFFGAIRDAAFYFGYGKLPGEREPEFAGESEVPKELIEYFNKLVSKMKSPPAGNSCLVDIGEIPKAKGFSIALYNDKIQIEEEGDRGNIPPYDPTYVDGFIPCSVDGEKFYDCLQAETKECIDGYKTDSIQIIINDDTEIAQFLFKFDDNHLCPIHLYDDGFLFKGNCDKIEGFIDDECINKIKEKYPECG
jgi:hypothetical protein